MRKVRPGNKISTRDGLSARHYCSFCQRFDASHGKFRKFFPRADRDRQTSPRAGLRGGFEGKKKRVPG
jgi:hypothetical protein